ncbi:hypothetical protein D932_03429 [Enterococcus casseliflavus 14-MB-W-14]|uniref:hypothetical protein n=1 Tax=Enterococcus casseliflavus TaxID=37734 RepID=UPI0003536EC6|nr:hypothetical protein [Enterococcus casseliflavus]EPH59988.1 hypothetical protein D932_03429 [Enterococcus casseliflavus 14-MB-W-14]
MAYTCEQEVLINGLIKERIRDLQLLIHEKKGQLSERQYEKARKDLEQYQEIQYQNRLNRQINY